MQKKELEKQLTRQGLAKMREIDISYIEQTAIIDVYSKTAKKVGFKWSYAVAALLIMVLLSAGIFGGVFVTSVDTELFIDINPSFKLSLTPLDKVEAYVALNEDAENIFDISKIENQPVDEACEYIFQTLYNLGYIKEGTEINLNAQGKNAKRAEKAMNRVKNNAESFMKNKNVNGKCNGKVNGKSKDNNPGNGNSNNDNGNGNGNGNRSGNGN